MQSTYRYVTLGALALSMLALAVSCGGCSSGALILQNAQAQCGRDYDGTISAGITGSQFTGKVAIHCPVPGAATPQTGAPQPTSSPDVAGVIGRMN